MEKREALKKYFGYDDFRNRQEEMIDTLLGGDDVLGVMPTGAGKSLCYQIPALLLPGITLVISPLISLMKDQVGALTAAGIPAAYINTALTASQTEAVLRRAQEGRYKLIYVAPERLTVPRFLRLCEVVKISLVAVDEAHCVSQWGHDFRSAYLTIADFIAGLKERPLLGAFTATATDDVRADICALLGLRTPRVFVSGFDRPNLYFDVRHPRGKFNELMHILNSHEGESGIIYCATRKTVEEVAQRLKLMGYGATRYHAGLGDRERKRNQDDFLYDRKPIMVATNAFGMGIDKSNVSFVVHYNMPKNMESYYQEAGRAGRDGGEAECILLYEKKDIVINRFFIDRSANDGVDPDLRKQLHDNEMKQLNEMIHYCNDEGCLRQKILGYFGETSPAACGHCGNCDGNFVLEDKTDMGREILRCVAETRQRFGMTMIADILHGSKNKRIRELGLDDLSSYGALVKEKTADIKNAVHDLTAAAYLSLTEGDYPVLTVTEKGQQALSGEEAIEIRRREETELPGPTIAVAPKKTVLSGVDEGLFDALRQKRKELAEAEGVPAFVIFSDATLKDMCAKLPGTEGEMLNVNGVGQVKLQKYGDIFLREIAAYGGSPLPTEDKTPISPAETDEGDSSQPVDLAVEVKPSPLPDDESGAVEETFLWTVADDAELMALLRDNNGIEAIAAHFCLGPDDIFLRIRELGLLRIPAVF